MVNDRSGNGRDAAIVNGNAGTVWNNGRGLNAARRQRRHLARRAAARLAAGRPEQRDDRLRRPALERHHAGAGVRVRPDGRQRRVPDRDAGRRHHSPLGVDRRRRARAPWPRPRPRRRRCREHLQARGGDDQGRRRADARPDAALRGRRARGLQHRADPQAVRRRLGDELHRPLQQRDRAAVPRPHQGLPHLLQGADGEPGAGALERARLRATWRSSRPRSTWATRAR